MGKSSSAKAEVVEYRMSLHVALGHEVDEIREIRVDERVAWSGRINTNTTLNIHQPNLFGGQTKEGGLSGFVQVLMGRPDQVLPAAAASRYRRSPNDCPAFRGLTTLMFHGSGMVSTGRPGEWDGGLIGVAINNARYDNSGFLWKMNSTFIAQKIEVTATRAPKGIDNQTPGLNPAYALIGNDANPAHIIYEALVNRSWGMSGAPELIDKAVFEAEALRLFNEGFGLSFWWMRQQTIEDLITEILDHIQATIFVNPNNGLLSIRLLRDDYDIATLRHITPDNATLSNFKRRSSGEIVNEITVNFTNPLNEESESVTGQDIASIESQGGEKVAASRDYYMVRSRELATKILDRDLRASTAPLVSAEAKLDRSAWNILPGEVVLLSWPRRSMNAVVARVGKVSYGKPRDTAIRASLMQDVFSLTKPPVRVLPPTDWEDPTRDPQPLDMQLFTVPNYFVRNVELQDVPVELGAGEALVGSLADSETYDSFDYELVSESVTASGAAVITSKGAKSMTPKGLLATTLPAAANSTLPFALFPVAEETPVKGGFVFIGYGDDNQEIALVTGQSPAGWTIARGCLDTVPRSWAAGTPVWVVSPGASIVDTQTIHAEGSTARYRGLDRTARGLLGYDQAPSESVVVTARPHLPLRPANVSVNNVAFGSLTIGSASTVVVRWATRNRLTEDSQVLLWGDGSVQPEYRQETVIRVYDAMTNALLKTYGGLWTETSASFNRADLERYQALRFEVLSRRNGEWSLTGHSVTVTGLAGDPSAPGLPATIAEAGPPPSFYPAPGVGAFAAQAVALAGAGGAENPAIEVSGTPDNLDMRGLATRYRRLPAPDPLTGVTPDIVFPWGFGPTAVLNGDDVRFLLTGVAAETKYEVQVAYVVDDLPGSWRNLGTVLTTRSIAGDITPTAPTIVSIRNDIEAAFGDIFDVSELVGQTRQAVEALEGAYGPTVNAATSAAAAAASEAAATQAKADAVIAKGEAQDARDEAAQKALDAAGSAAASAGSATAADNARAAAVIAKGEAQTARDTAATKATEAAGSASAALTSKNDAAASATTATQKATDAAGSAATATQQAGLAAGSATAAGGSASAAAGSASTASTKATEAGNSATAANAAKVAAESARDTADQKATAAASSASAAATSSTQAGQSASAAQTAKTDAETARAQAQTFRNEAADSATNAAGSAATASSAASQSVTTKDQAQGFATAANTSAQNAAGSATAAGNSASAANTSKTAAEAAYGASLAAAMTGFPDRVAADLFSASSNNVAPLSRPALVASKVVDGWYVANVSENGGIYYRSYIPWKQGEIYELTAEVEGLADTGTPPHVRLYGWRLNAAYGGPIYFDASATVPTPVGQKTVVSRRIGLGVTPPGGVQLNQGADGAWLNFGAIFNRTPTGNPGQVGAQSRIRLSLRNVTAQVAAETSASASATSAASAAASATLAGEKATAAQTSATAAETARGQAQTAATNAATSETNAAGSAADASSSASTAAQSQGAAAGSATAAAGSASTAATKATEAGNSATAANASKVAAESARDTADQKATAAASSASAAATSSTQAGQSASAAQTAKTDAETARAQAQTFRNEAADSATNAAGSAATAASAASQSVTAKDQAQGFANAANTSAQNAAGSATAAGNSASAANTSKTAAEAAYGASLAAAIAGFPDVLASDLLTALAAGSPTTVPSLNPAWFSAAGITPSANTAGSALYKQTVPWKSGEVYEFDYEVEGISGTTFATVFGQFQDASFAATTTRTLNWVATPNGVKTRIVRRIALDRTVAGATTWQLAGTGTDRLRFGVLFNRTNTGPAATGQARLTRMTVRNVTGLVDTQSVYDKTVILGGNQGFEDGLTGWGPNALTNPGSYGDSSVNAPIYYASYQGRSGVVVSAPGMGRRNLYSAKLFPIDTARKYRVRASLYVGPGAAARTYVGFRTLDAAGAFVGSNAGHQYVTIGGAVIPANSGWQEYVSPIMSGEGVAAGRFNTGTKLVQLVGFLDFDGANGSSLSDTALDGIWIEDVTESEAAKAQATASATSAANAAASATLAGEKATAAQTSATAADTSRGQAQTAASQASQSETNAAGSAASASSAATNAATSRDQASGFATAASGSASTASTKATEAGNSAAAAAASQVSASAAKDAAVSAKDGAETARGQAQSSATAAATSASSASASATTAGEKAASASGSAVTAATKAGEALSYAYDAATSAANAQGAAESIATSIEGLEARTANTEADIIDLENALANEVAARAEAISQVSARAGHRANLIDNPSGADDFRGWVKEGSPASYVDDDRLAGRIFVVYGYMVSQVYPAAPGDQHSLGFMASPVGDGGHVRLQYVTPGGLVEGVYVGAGGGAIDERRRSSAPSTAPAGTTGFRLVVAAPAGGLLPVWAIKVNFGSVAADFSDDYSATVLAATVTEQSLAIIDLENQQRLASFRKIAEASGAAPAYYEFVSSTSGGYAAIAAPLVALLNSIPGGDPLVAMQAIAGEVFFPRPVYVDLGGRRLIVGPGNGWVLWFGPDTISAAGATRTNGYFALGTDGKVYYGSAELGGGKTSGAKPFASGAGGAAASTAVSNVAAGSLINIYGSVDGGSLNVMNGTWNGTATVTESSGGTTTLYTMPISAVAGSLMLPNGSYQVETSAQFAGQKIGVRSGNVTYTVDITRTSGAQYVDGATINAVIIVTPPV